MGEYVRDEIDELCNLYGNHEGVLACLCVRTHGKPLRSSLPRRICYRLREGFGEKSLLCPWPREGAAPLFALLCKGSVASCIFAFGSAESPPWINGPQHDSQ